MGQNIKSIATLLFCVLSGNAVVAQTSNVDKIVSQMTLEEKLSQMYGVHDGTTYTINSALHQGLTGKSLMLSGGGVKRLGIPAMTFVDGPKGISYHGKHTIYPAPVLRGCSFDKDLEYRIGRALGMETAATGGNFIGAVTLNLTTHPRNGQAELWYGEDPWLAAGLGVALTKGIQQDHKVMACAKHYAMFELETNKGEINAVVTPRALNEVYLIPFMKVVEDANIASIMPSYNKVNGIFSSENKYLLTDIARNRWGFKGFYSSDWGFSVYHCLNAIKAGTNMEMPSDIHFKKDSIQGFVDKGLLSWSEIDNLVKPTIATKLQYANNESYRLSREVKEQLRNLSQESAEKSMVLLKNDNHVLPFDASSMKRVLVVGGLAKSGNLGETGYVPSHDYSELITPLRGIRRYLKSSGVSVKYCSGEDLQELSFMAQRADAIIVCVGRNENEQTENAVNPDTSLPLGGYMSAGDRSNLDLSLSEQNIIRTVYRAQKKMAVVYYGGSAVITSTWDHLTPALIFGGFGGANGGMALANILFGKVNPSGKLSFSIFERESDYPVMPDNPWNRATTKDGYNPYISPYNVDYDYYFGYTKADRDNIKVSYPFGYGLSYTSFSLENIKLSKASYGENDEVKMECVVRNTGNRAGGEVVQAYVGTTKSVVDRPEKSLRQFEKVYLQPGESKEVSISIPVKDLAYFDETIDRFKVEKTGYKLFVGTSSRHEDLQEVDFSIE